MKALLLKRLLLLYLLFCAVTPLPAQTLTLYALPSPHPINWKTPHHLVLSISRNFLSKKFHGYSSRPLGHVAVELAKDGDTLLTGMVADNKKDFFRSLFREKDGLGILFKFIDGHLEEKQFLGPEIEKRASAGRLAFIRFHINDSSYHYLQQYIDSFRHRGYDQLYNGWNDPLHGDGAGCTSFGVSFLELVHALDPEFTRQWIRDLPIPNRLLGNAITGIPVSVGQVFFSLGWAKDKTAHTHLRVYDPELMYRWIEHQYQQLNTKSSENFRAVKFGNARGVETDYREICRPRFPMFPVKNSTD